MNNTDREIEILTNATLLAGALLDADRGKREAMLPNLKVFEKK